MAQAVPSAVGLVPPTFPVSMGIPPPGYGPPPPFIRAGFNASQPPPGKWHTHIILRSCPHGLTSLCKILCLGFLQAAQTAGIPPASTCKYLLFYS